MAFPLLPLAVAGLTGVAWWRQSKNIGMTSPRTVVFETAMKYLRNPAELLELADSFELVGQPDEARELRMRASLRSATPEVKQARREAFDKARKCNDPAVVLEIAQAFESLGAYGAADTLYERVAKLREFAKEEKKTEDTSTAEANAQ